MSDSAKAEPGAPLGNARSALIAMLGAALASLGPVLFPAKKTSLAIFGQQLVFTFGRSVGAALLVWALIRAAQRYRFASGRRGFALLSGLCIAIGVVTLPPDVEGFAYELAPSVKQVAAWAITLLVAAAVPAGLWVAIRIARPRWRWLAVVGGLAALGVNGFILSDGYEAAHLFLAAAGVAVIAGGLHNAPAPRRLPSALPTSRVRRRLVLGFVAALVLAIGASLVVSPRPTVGVRMARNTADVVTPWVRKAMFVRSRGRADVPEQWKPWFTDRTELPGIPASTPTMLPPDSIVLFLTIDSLRADMMYSRRWNKKLANLKWFRKHSVDFLKARSPGSQTVYALAQMFMGTYYSQQYWSPHQPTRDLWPDDDETGRFPEYLANAGVVTSHYATTKWIDNEHGLVRGFVEDEWVKPKKTRYTTTDRTFPRIEARLEEYDGGQLFIYTHILDAHFRVSPVKKGKGKTHFLANLLRVDKRLGALRRKVDSLGLSDKTYFVISSDHGEAFGQHGTKHHRNNIYEELLRVPLMFYGPGLEPRKVKEPVTLMDLGPTFLDMYGLPTPAYFMGESLVPFLRGEDVELSRPILAEGRLKKALIFEDGLKAIVDDKNLTVELYDLVGDPKESTNLMDDPDSPYVDRIAVLRQFFDVHEIRVRGYKPPYRP